MDSSAGEEETCLRRDSWCPVVPVCHCYTQPSIYVHNKAPAATYLMRNTSIWCRGSRPIYKSRNSALQQRTKIRNNTQTCRVDPGSVSALQRSMLFEFCVRRVRCVCRGLTDVSLLDGSGSHIAQLYNRKVSECTCNHHNSQAQATGINR